MSVILDTNVFLSGIFFAGVPGRILDGWRRGEITTGLAPAQPSSRQLAFSNSPVIGGAGQVLAPLVVWGDVYNDDG